MSIFEKFFKVSDENHPEDLLHKDFTINNGRWYFNRELRPNEEIDRKIRFGLNNLEMVDGCKFLAKIGHNLDDKIKTKFIGFAYGNKDNEENLKEWSKKFPYAEMIIGLDNNGAIKTDSKVNIIKEDSLDD
jgi:tRNA(Ile)-lysidine synthase TilS/MesJ